MDTPTNNHKPTDEKPVQAVIVEHSKTFKVLVVVLFELILLIGAFTLGLRVGVGKAGYTYSWAVNYPNNFVGGRRILMPPPPQFINAHGLDGTILSMSNSNLYIKDEDGNENTIVVSPTTSIRQNFQSLQVNDLKVNEEIVVIGSANDKGQIDAKLIRVLNP